MLATQYAVDMHLIVFEIHRFLLTYSVNWNRKGYKRHFERQFTVILACIIIQNLMIVRPWRSKRSNRYHQYNWSRSAIQHSTHLQSIYWILPTRPSKFKTGKKLRARLHNLYNYLFFHSCNYQLCFESGQGRSEIGIIWVVLAVFSLNNFHYKTTNKW